MYFCSSSPQLQVQASDGAANPKVGISTVVITVRRNLHAPQFSQQRRDLDVLETHALGTPLLTLEATDDDDKVMG